MFRRLYVPLCNALQRSGLRSPEFIPTVETILVIVESPNKIKLVENHVQAALECNGEKKKRVKAMATIGHFMEMVDVKLNEAFGVKWQISPDKHERIEGIRSAIQHPLISEVVLASDPDREGELIAAHVHDALFPKSRSPRFSRAYFYAMTKEMIIEGFESRQASFIDRNLVDSALARHIIDRMFGFVASTHLMLDHACCRSIGRVQTPALNLIENRDRAIQEYEKRGATYTFTAEPIFSLRRQEDDANAVKGSFCGDLDVSYGTEDECQAAITKVLSQIEGKTPHSMSIKESTKTKSPPPPLTMATLIDAASRTLRLKGEAVTTAAQSLFTLGLITYPRSDSERLSDDFEARLAAYIKENFGACMLYSGRKVRKRSSNAEGAHEAIHPTDLMKLPSSIQVQDGNARALYALIHDHTVASRMQPTVTKVVNATMEFKNSSEMILTRVSQSYVHDFGYVKSFDNSIIQSRSTSDQKDAKAKYSDILSMRPEDIRVAQVKTLRHSDSKPTRFTEGSLITALKDAGIGRPSTYASTLQKLNARGYTKYFDAKGKLALGPNGNIASAFAKEKYQNFVRMDFTGSMENDLNSIANGGRKKIDVVRKFWSDLKGCLAKESYGEAATVQEFTQQFRIRYGNSCQGIQKLSSVGVVNKSLNRPVDRTTSENPPNGSSSKTRKKKVE